MRASDRESEMPLSRMVASLSLLFLLAAPAGALLEYFAPLKAWLDRQNAGAPVGW